MKNKLAIYAIDTETTGITPNDQVIELASIRIPTLIKDYHDASFSQDLINNTYDSEHTYVERFMPSVTINPHAQKVHGISKLKLVGKRSYVEAKLPMDASLLVGHNTVFDKRMLRTNIKHVCVWRMAQKIEKINGRKLGFENYKLITMFEYYYPELKMVFKTEYHSALGDTRMVVLVLIKLLEQFPFLHTMHDVEDYFFGDIDA